MRKWQSLISGDIVDIVAPGSGTSAEDLSSAAQFLKSWKLVPRVANDIFSGHPYLSNSDQYRVHDLKRALLAKDSKAVWCLRGGYGSLRLIPELLKIKPPAKNKIFIGYSDITSLHLFLMQKWKWVTCHGPLLDGLGRNKYPELEVRELANILFGEQDEITFDDLEPLNTKALKIKKIKGPLVGGNLVVLTSHCGTRLSPQIAGKILFLEEISERGYRLDRMLAQLQQTGALEKAKAILIGDIVGGSESNGENFCPLAMKAWAESLKIPVFKNLPVGHGSLNRPLFLGPESTLEKTLQGFRLTNHSGVI